METCEMGDEVRFTDKDLLLFLQCFYVPALFQSRTAEQKMPDRSIETKTRGYVDDLIRGKGEEHKMVLSQKIMLFTIAPRRGKIVKERKEKAELPQGPTSKPRDFSE